MNADPPIRILIADDRAIIRESLTALLNQQKMLVVAQACNGQEAVDLYREHRPDITLMDLRMPIMNGLAATRAIVAEFPHAQIIVLTNSEGEEANSLRAGAVAYFLKDTSYKDLFAAIRSLHDMVPTG